MAAAGVGFFELSADEGFVVDASLLSALGYSDRDVSADAAAFFRSLLQPDDAEQIAADHRQLLAGEIDHCRRELCLRRADGTDVWFRCVANRVQGHVIGMLSCAEEEHALSEAVARERRRLEAVVDNMPLGLVSFRLDPAGTGELLLQLANPAARNMTNLDWRIGRPARELFPGASPEDFVKRAAVALGGPSFTESKRRYVDGIVRGAFDTTFFNSGQGEVSGIFHDVTEHVRIEDELRRSNESLEQFAFSIAHDLKEPVRMVLAFSELLERALGELPSGAVLPLRYVREGALRMSSLIRDLLAYARIGGVQDPGVIDANAVLASVIADFAGMIGDTNAQIIAEDLPTVRCFDVELRQVFTNLLGNAMKFRGASAPKIEVRALKHGDHAWEFRITDNGIGMHERDANEAFRLFGRLHHRNTYEGNGIGLAICKRIVEHNRGSIWISSTLGVGSTVHFTLEAG